MRNATHKKEGIMFRIKWNNGYTDYVTTYYAPFKRLDYCNAAWYEIEETTSEYNALQHTIQYHEYGFVSYDTPICKISYWHDIDTNKDGYNVYVNRESYRCSSSTIHQLVRFLRRTIGDLVTYQMIKELDNEYPFFKDVSVPCDKTHIYLFWVEPDIMRHTMGQMAHAIYHTNKA